MIKKSIQLLSNKFHIENKRILLLSIIILFCAGLIIGLATFVAIKHNFHIILPAVLSIGVGLVLLIFQLITLAHQIVNTEKKLLESNKQLKDSEERYSLATKGSHTGLWDWEVGTDRVFYSPLLKLMLGFKEDEFPNSLSAFKKQLHPDDINKVFNLINQHLEKYIPYNIEYRLKTKSGTYRWFHAVGQALWDQNDHPTRMAGSIIDITERKKAEQRLAAQYAVTHVLSEATDLNNAAELIIEAICKPLEWECGSIWMVDKRENYLHNIGTWNQPFLREQAKSFIDITHSYTFAPGVGLPGRVWNDAKPAWIFDVVVDKNFPRAPYAKIADLHSAFCFPILLQKKVLGVIEFFTREMQTPDKKLLSMMASIGPQVGLFIQRKWIENELRESETYKKAILESASDSIITMSNNHTILSFNSQTMKLFGYSSDELSNKNINDLLPDLSKKIEKMIQKPAAELKSIRKNGDIFYVELTISKMQLGKNEIYVSIIRDITERKKIEQIKTEFISTVSHELRTPLTSIKGAIGLLQGHFSSNFSGKENQLLDIANTNCDRLVRLINDILDIEKIESGKMAFNFKCINISELIHDAVKINEEYARNFNIKVKICHDVAAFVYGDYDRLMQVVTNLLSNAIKFSPKNGESSIDIVKNNEMVRISIKDYGDGISDEFKPKVFSKFSQENTSTTRNVGGTGLGLSISKSIIEQHKGKINFESKKGEGSVFYFDLPILNTNNEIEKSPEISEPIANISRLLICEDNKDCANFLREILEKNNFNVDIASTINEAKQLLAKNQYEAMTLNVIFQNENSLDLIKELQTKKEFNRLPIIIISIQAKSNQEKLSGNAFPIIGWIEKPIDESLLIKLINKLKYDKPLILHVEDDPEIVGLTKLLLENEAKVIHANSVHSAKTWLDKEEFDLIILDIKLPDGSGLELLPCINFRTKRIIPVILFSAYDLGHDYAKYVYATIIKSTTTNETLLNTIKSAINENYT